jgi:uncharacterized protein YktA (UPF0223 family)
MIMLSSGQRALKTTIHTPSQEKRAPRDQEQASGENNTKTLMTVKKRG